MKREKEKPKTNNPYETYTTEDGQQRFRLTLSSNKNPDTFKSMTDSFNSLFSGEGRGEGVQP